MVADNDENKPVGQLDYDDDKPVWPTWAVGVLSGARCRNIQPRTPFLEVSQGLSDGCREGAIHNDGP
jgi:hypothetical protein